MSPARARQIELHRQKIQARDAYNHRVSPDRISFGPPEVPDERLQPRDRAERWGEGEIVRAAAKVIDADECGVTLIYRCPYCLASHEVIVAQDEPGRAVSVPCGPWRAFPDVGLEKPLPLPPVWERRRAEVTWKPHW